MLAIFKQQLCSSSVISRPAVTHATSGCPKSSSITIAATSFETLLNILILPHRCNKIASNKVVFASLCLPGRVASGRSHIPSRKQHCRKLLRPEINNEKAA
jgi:hypothetical protein